MRQHKMKEEAKDKKEVEKEDEDDDKDEAKDKEEQANKVSSHVTEERMQKVQKLVIELGREQCLDEVEAEGDKIDLDALEARLKRQVEEKVVQKQTGQKMEQIKRRRGKGRGSSANQ